MFISSYWPNTGTPAANLRSIYDRVNQQLEAEAERKKLNPKPFLQTDLGRMAPEIRNMIFIDLLAMPPPYAGRDFRVEQASMSSRPPIPLTGFIDLKASCLPVLQTCHQIYLEAYPIFYAGKSYHLANSQDMATFFKFGGYPKIGPCLFRFDTITSLCFKDLVINRLKWNPQQIDDLMSRALSFTRERLETQRTIGLDSQLLFLDWKKMKSLRKICLCMRVGQEWHYLGFLFSIEGLRRGVIDFVDNFHWTIRSQSVLGDDWNLQYSAFPNIFYRRGKNFELLDFHDVNIQGEVLNIDSRASDLREGDERWIEVDIGSRNYDERRPEPRPAPDIIPDQVSEHQQGLPRGEGIDPPTDDGSDHGSEDLHGQSDWEEDVESNEDFDDLQEQSNVEDDDTQTHNEPNDESEGLQGRQDREAVSSQAEDEPDQESSHSQDLSIADNDNAQAESESDSNQELGTYQGTLNNDYTAASTEVIPEEPETLQEPLDTHDRNAPTATESNEALEDSVELVDDRMPIASLQVPAIVPEVENEDNVEAPPEDQTQATTELSSGFQHQNDSNVQTHTESVTTEHRNAETQTESVATEYENTDTQTEPGEFAKDPQEEDQAATALTPQSTVHQANVQDGQQTPTQPKPQPLEESQEFGKLPPETKMATKLLHKNNHPPIPQKSPQKPINSPIRERPQKPLATMDSNPTSKTKGQSQPSSHAKGYQHGCIRAALLMPALALFYTILYGKPKDTLSQLLALFLFILLLFSAHSSEGD